MILVDSRQTVSLYINYYAIITCLLHGQCTFYYASLHPLDIIVSYLFVQFIIGGYFLAGS